MKHNFFSGMLAMLMLAGCSNEELLNEDPEGMDAKVKKSQAEASALGGPLFDLETAPNGDVLVADYSQGITDLWGNLETSLPAVTSVSAVGRGNMWATTGPDGPGTADAHQRLFQVHKNNAELVVDLFAFEATHNPDGGNVDSNPFSVLALNGNSALVVDSGGNDLLRVDNKGNVEVLAIFPTELVSTANVKSLVGCPGSQADLCFLPDEIPTEAVPTSVVIGPDGYFFVGELKGFPAPTGASNIWKIASDAMEANCPSPDCVKLFDGGFTSIIDMAFGDDGLLYVAEMDARSWFAVEAGVGEGGRIQACDPQTLHCDVVATGIPMLTSIVFDKDGNLWATRMALVNGQAEVLQIPL